MSIDLLFGIDLTIPLLTLDVKTIIASCYTDFSLFKAYQITASIKAQ